MVELLRWQRCLSDPLSKLFLRQRAWLHYVRKVTSFWFTANVKYEVLLFPFLRPRFTCCQDLEGETFGVLPYKCLLAFSFLT